MNTKLSASLFLLVSLSLATAQTVTSARHTWNDSTRDVYIDAQLDRAAQVLTCDSPKRIAIISPGLKQAVLLDLVAKTVNLLPKEVFQISADRNTATSDSTARLESIGKYSAPDSTTYLLSAEGKQIMFRSHPGVAGEMNESTLWETVPVWRSLMESYKPDAAAVAKLKKASADTEVTVVFGTWCPDSRNYVPRLLQALHTAQNSKLRIKLVGIDNQFRQPVNTIQPRGIINVPTVIVEQGGRELGRIIETPAAKTMEEDLVAILGKKQPVHVGRWERGPEVAHGAYIYNDQQGKECGTETWRLYRTSEGGFLLHSVIKRENSTTEVFHRVNATQRTTFAEVTRRQRNEVTRVRYNVDDHTLTARARGNVAGIIQQTLEVPSTLIFSSPAIAAEGWGLTQGAGRGVGVHSYSVLTTADVPLGAIEPATCEAKGEETVATDAGEFKAKHVVFRSAAGTSDWWLHPTLGVPVHAKVAGGQEYVLTSLEISAKKN